MRAPSFPWLNWLHWVIATAGILTATNSPAQTIPFPKGFRWCVSTSAHQIEGGNTASDWWAWEQVPGHIDHNDVSGMADDHWNRVDRDIELMRDLNITDYRLSIEWAKIEPLEGRIDAAAVAHYREEIQELQSVGIRPIITLHHFTFPQWVRAKGGWEWEGIDAAFTRFVEIVYENIAPDVQDWITINEPMIAAVSGYLGGRFPPGENRPLRDLLPVILGSLRSHAKAYHRLHDLAAQHGRTIRVGMAHALRTLDPYHSWSPLDILLSWLADSAWNWAVPDALETGRLKFQLPWLVDVDEKIDGLEHTQDFVGINYYSGDLVEFSFAGGYRLRQRKHAPKTDLGWDIYPRGLYRILTEATRRYPDKSIFITENGIADAKDLQRSKYIYDHLKAVADAISEGAPVEGYCYWSLLDNFEWANGFWPRFGLYEVDYQSFERRPRESARYFSEIARSNSISPPEQK